MSYFRLKNGERLYYEDVGTGEDVFVMLHGWTSSHTVYKKVVKALKKRARCIVYDQRGHGASREANRETVTMETLAEDLQELLAGFSLNRVTLLGWSMGAGVVMNYVRMYGCEKLKQVVLCDMTPRQLNDDSWNLGLYCGNYRKQDMEKTADQDFYSLYRGFAIGAVPRLGRVPEFLLKRLLDKRLAACDETVLKSLSKSMKEQDNRNTLGMVTVPVSYFYADPGSLFSPKLADWYKENINTTFQAVRFPDCTHMFVVEKPKKFAEELRQLCAH